MPKTLHLTLTHHWWEEIAAGRKTSEYRRFTEGWRKRLSRIHRGDLVVFHRGYTDRIITRRIENIRIIVGWDLPNEVYCFFGKPNEDKFFEIQFNNE
nr:MAG TPA: activating signal cointegrator [Caudoviricetes sp.]